MPDSGGDMVFHDLTRARGKIAVKQGVGIGTYGMQRFESPGAEFPEPGFHEEEAI